MEAPPSTVDRHHRELIEEPELTYDNPLNMFSIRIHHGGKFISYPGRMYVSGRVDIFDMVDIDLFTVVALNMMVLKLGYTGESEPMFYNYLRPLTSLDVGLYALACEEDVHCLITFVMSFKLIEVYIEHGVTILDSYLKAPRFRATLEDIIDEHAELDGEAGFADVPGSGVDSSGLSHDESFGEPDVGPTQEPILAEVSTQEPIVAEGNGQEDESTPTDGQFFYDDEGIDITYETEYDVQSSEDPGIDDDDDVDEDFLVDEENEIVEPDVDVYLFGISMYLPFDNIGITNLVLDDVLEGEDVDVINAGGFDSDPSNDEDRNYRKRRLAELRTEMEGVINASEWKLDLVDQVAQLLGVKKEEYREINQSTYKFLFEKISEQVRVNPDIPVKTVQDQLQHELEVQISMSKDFRAKAKAKREIRGYHVLQYSMLRDYVVKLQSTNPNTTVKITVERNTDPSLPTRVFQRIYVCLGALKLVGLDSNNGIYPLAYALVEAETKSSWYWFLQCLGDDIDLHPNSNFIFITDRQKGIILAIKTVYPSAKHIYCLRHIHKNIKQGWCGQAYKDLLWRAASTTNVRDFEKCMLEFKTMNPKAHEWLVTDINKRTKTKPKRTKPSTERKSVEKSIKSKVKDEARIEEILNGPTRLGGQERLKGYDEDFDLLTQETQLAHIDPGENSSQSPPHIDHYCCYGCGDSLDDIFCQRCTGRYTYTPEPSHYQKILIYYDDEESSTPLRDIIISKHPLCTATTPVLSTEEPKDSLIMGDEYLDTIPEKELDEFIKSSVENLVSNPSESEDLSNIGSECDVPVCDDFITFSNLLFDADDNFSSTDDELFSDEDVPKEIYSNPLFDEEIISIKIDPHHFNDESDLIESLLNQDPSIISSSKIDSLLDEFTGELIFLKSIPPGIDEADCDSEEEIRLIEKLLYDNSFPRPSKEFNSKNSNVIIKSFSPSFIPVEDSDSLIEEIDLSPTLDDSMPSGIENDDYDSEGDIIFLEELLSNDSLSLLKNESFHFDIPSSPRPPAKPPDDDEIEPDTGVLTIKVMGVIYEHYAIMPRLLPTLTSNEEKSPHLLSHRGLKAFQLSFESPMMIYRRDSRAKSDLLLNNICEVFNGKIVRGRDKPVITLLEYIREYCMKRIVNVQGVIDKCIGPLTPTTTRIMESIKKKAHLMNVQWNGANKYQVSGSLGDRCVVDVVSMTCSCREKELTGIPCKHDVAACWNMTLNDQATPPPETWVGRPKKKRKRSKHEDEPFVKDGKLSRKGITITCQSCRNIGHNRETCKGQGGNNAEGLSAAAGEGGVGDPGGAGVASQCSSHTRWIRRRVQT
nr:hypothetical protein [Tanacetum cinerariifolium]